MNRLKGNRSKAFERILERNGYRVCYLDNDIAAIPAPYSIEFHDPARKEPRAIAGCRDWRLNQAWRKSSPCAKCGAIGYVTSDHIHEKVDGGLARSKLHENRQPLCLKCHRRKTSLSIELRKKFGKMSLEQATVINRLFLSDAPFNLIVATLDSEQQELVHRAAS